METTAVQYKPYLGTFSSNLKKLRAEDAHESDETFLQRFWITKDTYQEWLQGAELPDIITLIDVCKYYNVSIDKMLGFKTFPTGTHWAEILSN